jgi:hypothetical protein
VNPKLIEAQIRAQALSESWRASMVEFNAQLLKARAQAATAEEAKSHMESLEIQVQEANKVLVDLAEKEDGRRALAGGMRAH